MVATSLKSLPEIAAYPPTWLPGRPQVGNYVDALTHQPFGLFFRNSLIVAAGTILGDLLAASLVAYGFARFRFPGRDVLFVILLSTMMVPFVVRLVPLFVIFQKLGWVNTFYPLIVPHWFGTPFFIFLMRQFFLTIPAELAESARIDGASEFAIWWRIMLPLTRPALLVIAIFSFQYTWNDFLAPLIFLNDTSMKTVTLGLYSMIGFSGQESWNWIMAAATAIGLPVVVVFYLFQRQFIQGVTISGVKG
ncbi:MAG: carbohydrate ABC transporter permease [Candidatus Rokubacteria bacterium]|nr:carbohydrate ABC transporter permease [Candidatus Rokubacteria bacterium]